MTAPRLTPRWASGTGRRRRGRRRRNTAPRARGDRCAGRPPRRCRRSWGPGEEAEVAAGRHGGDRRTRRPRPWPPPRAGRSGTGRRARCRRTRSRTERRAAPGPAGRCRSRRGQPSATAGEPHRPEGARFRRSPKRRPKPIVSEKAASPAARGLARVEIALDVDGRPVVDGALRSGGRRTRTRRRAARARLGTANSGPSGAASAPGGSRKRPATSMLHDTERGDGEEVRLDPHAGARGDARRGRRRPGRRRRRRDAGSTGSAVPAASRRSGRAYSSRRRVRRSGSRRTGSSRPGRPTSRRGRSA